MSKKKEDKNKKEINKYPMIFIAISILILGLIVIIFPGITYTPTQRVILFLIISILPTILFADSAVKAKFVIKLPGITFLAMGTFAALLGTTFFLNYLAKPEQQIAGYNIYKLQDNGSYGKMELNKEMVELETIAKGEQSYYIDNNTIIIVFPEQLPKATIILKPYGNNEIFECEVRYTSSNINNRLFFDKDFKKLGGDK